MTAAPAFDRFRALGTLAVVGAADPTKLTMVTPIVAEEIDTCDRACSRFRDDSELTALNRAGELSGASEWLCEAVSTALRAAADTDGLVDPTIGQTLIDLGYDRSFERLDPSTPLVVTARHVPAWWSVSVDPASGRICMPSSVRLDLGATAKALCSDRAATRAAAECGTGVLVSLGGDIAVAGDPPHDGWIVRVTDRAEADPNGPTPGQTVALRTGGLATSGTAVRRWARAGTLVHHLVDPRTSKPAAEAWRTVTVAAPSCREANVASTAAMILGCQAPEWLESRGVDARLVSPDGDVVATGRWPSELPIGQQVPA